MGPPYGKLPILFPYHSHIFRDSYGSGMGIVWEAYHKGVPLLGVPRVSLDIIMVQWKIAIFEKVTILLDATQFSLNHGAMGGLEKL